MNTAPKENESIDRKPFPFQAAVYGPIIPVFAAILSIALRQVIDDLSILFIAIVAVCSIGLLLSLLATQAVVRFGTEELLVKGAIGVVLNSVVLWVLISNYQIQLQKIERARAQEKMAEATGRVVGQHLSGSNVTSSLTNLSSELARKSKQLTGTEKQFTQASAGFARRLHAATVSYEEAAHEFQPAKLLDFSGIDDTNDLVCRIAIIKPFAEANDELKQIYQRIPEIYREELQKAGMEQGMIQDFVLQIRSRGRTANQIQTRVRENDAILARSSLTILNLMEKRWGHWKFDPVLRQVQWESSADRERFEAALAQIAEATEATDQLNRRLLESRQAEVKRLSATAEKKQ